MTDRIPASARSRGKIAPAKVAHIVLRTNRYDEMVAWWRCFLEAEPMHANPFITFLTFDEEHHRLAIARGANLADKVTNSVGVDHFAFTSIHHGVSLSFYYLDPDRNQAELQIDAFPSVEATNAFLAGGAFARNPIGVLFDPDALVKRWREGASDAELLRPLEGGVPDLRSVFAEH